MNEMPTFDTSAIASEFNPLSNALDVKQNQYAGDEKLNVSFQTVPVLHPFKSTEAGRPIYEDQDMVVIYCPGNVISGHTARMRGEYMERFGDKYRKWKAGQAAIVSGTPLENYPALMTTPSVIAELKYRNIFTVEQLAEMSDTAKQAFMGGFELSKRAATWIAKSAADAVDAEKEELKKRVAEMEAQMAQLLAASAPKRGKIKQPEQGEIPAFMQE